MMQLWMNTLKFLLLVALTVFVVAVTLQAALWLPEVLQVQAAGAQVEFMPTPTSSITPVVPPIVITPLPPVDVPPPAPTPIPVILIPRLQVGAGMVNVRSGPGTHYARLDSLAPGAEAFITGRYGEWWQIAYAPDTAWVFGGVVTAFDVANVHEVAPPTFAPMPDPPFIPNPLPAWAIDEPRWIDVDLTEQRLTAYEHGVPVRTYLVSTGRAATPTPVGQFRIWIKLRTDDMSGPGYDIKDVPFVMYFYRGYGLHGVTWHANFGHPMSHGCVNQPTAEAEWLFDFAQVGTLVNIHE